VFADAMDNRRDDPWWRYLQGSGRGDAAARRAFADRVRALPLPSPDAWRQR
jgi:hypothetical protein